MTTCAKCEIPTPAIAVFTGNVGACPEHVTAVLAELMEIRQGEARLMLKRAEVIDNTGEEGE